MKKPAILIIAVLAAVVVVGGAFALMGNKSSKDVSHNDAQGSTSSSTETAKANEVFIKDFAFGPSKITIKKGTTVTWTNKDAAHHDISPDKKDDPNFKASELLAKGQSYTYTFNAVGTYAYHCTPHPYMKAMVEVTE